LTIVRIQSLVVSILPCQLRVGADFLRLSPEMQPSLFGFLPQRIRQPSGPNRVFYCAYLQIKASTAAADEKIGQKRSKRPGNEKKEDFSEFFQEFG